MEPPVPPLPIPKPANTACIWRAELDRAIAQLEVGRGCEGNCTALSLLQNSPCLSAEKEAVLELIYAEYVTLEEFGISSPVEAWYREFPHWKDDLDELFRIDRYLNRSSLSTIDDEAVAAQSAPSQDIPRRIDRFEIQEKIGFGASGVVYRARQLDLGRVVAMKLLSVSGVGYDEHRARLQGEAEAIAKLQHPHIVQVFDVDTAGKHPYLAMEYVSGGTLADEIKRQLFSPHSAARFLEVVARAIQHAHSHGIVHRDLKPANILLAAIDRVEAFATSESVESLSQRYEPKISDFGLAKHIGLQSGMTIDGAVFGTPSYMAPEQAAGESSEATAAVDIYSLGAVLYEMLTGRPPFRGATVGATLEQVRRDDPLEVRRLQPHVPRDLETICMKCLRKAPDQRYATALDLANDLARFLEGRPILARPIGLVESCAKWTRRHPTLALLFATVLLSLMAMGVLWRRAETHRVAAEDHAFQAVSARNAEAHERKLLEQTVYAHDVSLAHFEYLNNNTTRAIELLHSCPATLRGWEWNFVDDRCHEPIAEFGGFQREIRAVAISPDGSLVAGASGAWGFSHLGEIRLFDTQTGQLKWELRHQAGPVMDIEFDSTGRWLVSAGTTFGGEVPGGVIVWDMQNGKSHCAILGANAHSIAFSPDGQSFLVGHVTGLISQHQTDTARCVLKQESAHQGLVLDLDYRADGKVFLSTGRDGQIAVWKSDSLEQIATVKDLGDVRRGDFSPEGTSLAITTFAGDLRVYRLEGNTLEQSARFARGARSGALGYSPDGQSLALSSLNQSLRLVDPKTGQLFQEFHGHQGYQSDVDFSASGRWMVTAGGGLQGGLTLWDLSRDSGEWSRVLAHPFIGEMAYLPDGRHLAIVHSRNTSFPDQATERVAKLFDVRSKQVIRTFSGHTGWLTSVAADPQGRWILSGSEDHTARLWDVKTGLSLHEWKECPDAVVNVDFARDGELAIVTGRDGSIFSYQTSSGQRLNTWKSDQPIVRLAMRDAHLAFATLHKEEIQLWNDSSNTPVIRISTNDRQINCLQWSPDGKWLALGRDDADIELWSIDNQLNVNLASTVRLRGHIGAVRDLAFSRDGRRLFSTGVDRTAKCWDLSSGLEVLSLSGVGLAGTASHLAVDPTGQQLAFADANVLKIWSLRGQSPSPAEDRDAAIRWHLNESENARSVGNGFAMLFHLKQVAALRLTSGKPDSTGQ